MSPITLNEKYIGCLFIWRNENYLVNEITELDNAADIVNLFVVNAKGDFMAITCSRQEFLESVVK